MKKLLLPLIALVGLTSCSTAPMSPTPYSQLMVESHGLGDFYCNRNHHDSLATVGWDYVSGLVANAVLNVWLEYPEKTAYYDAVKDFADGAVSADGMMIRTKKGTDALRPSNIDDLPAGNVFFELYKEELKRGNTADADRYKNAATLIRTRLTTAHSRIAEGLPGAGGFFHKAIYPNQMWLDGLFMGSPVYARHLHYFGGTDKEADAAAWSDIAHQFKTIHYYTYDADYQLNYHAWSATPEEENSFWAKKTEPHMGCSPEFWARGMGWYFAALVDVLEMMPKDHPEFPAVHNILLDVSAGLARWQDKESGVWYQLLRHDASVTADGIGDTVDGKVYNVGTQANYLEASASGIFTYAYLKGIRVGLLDAETYLPIATKAYAGLVERFIRQREDGLIDVVQTCASAGLGPKKDHSRTGTINYYLAGKDITVVENEGKAIGTFIMASLEWELSQKN